MSARPLNVRRIIGDPLSFIEKDDTTKIKPLHEFKSNYQVVDEIGFGPTSRVDTVSSLSGPDNLASKTIDRSNLESSFQLYGYLQIFAKLESQRLVKIYDAFGDDRTIVFVEEKANNGNLLDFLERRKGEFNESDASRVVQQIVEGVEYLHQNKIAHTNLKPENVLFGDDDNVKLSDFAFNKIMQMKNLQIVSSGSPEFLPPELLVDKEPTFESDVWNIGVLAYFLLTGNSPFPGSQFKKYQAIASGKVELGEEFGFSDEARDFIQKCLTKDVKSRITIKDALQHPWFSNPGSNPAQTEKFIELLNLRRQTSINPDLSESLALRLMAIEEERARKAEEEAKAAEEAAKRAAEEAAKAAKEEEDAALQEQESQSQIQENSPQEQEDNTQESENSPQEQENNTQESENPPQEQENAPQETSEQPPEEENKEEPPQE